MLNKVFPYRMLLPNSSPISVFVWVPSRANPKTKMKGKLFILFVTTENPGRGGEVRDGRKPAQGTVLMPGHIVDTWQSMASGCWEMGQDVPLGGSIHFPK